MWTRTATPIGRLPASSFLTTTDVSCWPWGTMRISPSVPGGSRSVVASRRGRIPRAAAVREVFEETGIRLETSDLVGPVLYRTAEFDFLAVTARQDEWFFIAHAPSTTLSRDGWTELERSVIDTQRWWDIDEAAATIDGEIYPAQILEFAHVWKDGWDGQLIELTDTREP